MNEKHLKKVMSELGKKSAEKRKGQDYKELANKRWKKEPENVTISEDTQSLRVKAIQGRVLFKNGEIDKEMATIYIQPYLDAVNKKAKTLAKEYGVAFKPVTMTGFLR